MPRGLHDGREKEEEEGISGEHDHIYIISLPCTLPSILVRRPSVLVNYAAGNHTGRGLGKGRGDGVRGGGEMKG